MEIIQAEEAGFCFGVRRALQLAEEATREYETVYSLGPLIHNRQVVDHLRRQGLVVCDSLEDLPAHSTALIRAHGTGPATYELAQQRQLTLIDATCPFVARVHRRAAEFAQQDYQVLVLGDSNHPEAQGIMAHTGGQAVIVQTSQDLEKVSLRKRIAVVCQTTQTREALRALVEALLAQVSELVVANTICDATTKRQESSVQIARQVDVMIVVGGYHSANTQRLAEICAAAGTPTHHVEVAPELRDEWLQGVEKVGVTAGASTPEEAIEAVIARLQQITEQGENQNAQEL